MKFAAAVTLNQLRGRRDLAVHVVSYTFEGGVELLLLDISRPVRRGHQPIFATILPTGDLLCPGCDAIAA